MASLNPNTNALGTAFAKHLLKRATFSYTKPLVDQFAALTPQQALDLLFQDSPLVLPIPDRKSVV